MNVLWYVQQLGLDCRAPILQERTGDMTEEKDGFTIDLKNLRKFASIIPDHLRNEILEAIGVTTQSEQNDFMQPVWRQDLAVCEVISKQIHELVELAMDTADHSPRFAHDLLGAASEMANSYHHVTLELVGAIGKARESLKEYELFRLSQQASNLEPSETVVHDPLDRDVVEELVPEE